jgi:DNA polymerase III epsilon subunit-like protein
MAIIDRQGNIYETFNFVIYDVFVGMKDLMATAYYAEKIPQYEQDLKNGVRKMVKWRTAVRIIRQLIKKYTVKAVIAHNTRFDMNAINNTNNAIETSYKYVFPYGIEKWCTLRMAQQTFAKSKKYIKYCEDFGYLTKNNRPKLTAEVLYRYITGDELFNEAHTALQDVYCELVILLAEFAFHKKLVKTYYNPKVAA